MVDVFTSAEAALVSAERTAAGRTVTYHRGAATVAVVARIAQTTFKTIDQAGQTTYYQSRDFLVEVSELILTGHATTPKRGDRIVDTIAGQVVTFEVAAPDGEGPFRYSGETTYRIHTKQVSRV